MSELKEIIEQTKGELAGFIARAQDEIKNLGKMSADTATAVQTVTKRLDEMEVKAAMARTSLSGGKTIAQELKENESIQRLCRDRRGTALITFAGGITELERKARADWEQKTTITSSAVGSATSGVLLFDRAPGIVPAARRRLTIRDLLTTIPTGFNAIDYVKVNADISDASPQVEASDKYENALTFNTATANVRTIATWIPATRQVLDDFDGLEGFIRTSLVFAVRKEEEDQLLSGDNTGQNLNGLITQAQAFNTALLIASDGWEKVDIIGRAIQQIAAADEESPDFVVLHPTDYWGIRLTKDSQGRYIFGNPDEAGPVRFFGLTPIITGAITAASFLVGSSAPNVAVIRDRMDLTVEISTEHSDYFIKNMVAIRAEERLALVVFRPNAAVTGTLNTSPV